MRLQFVFVVGQEHRVIGLAVLRVHIVVVVRETRQFEVFAQLLPVPILELHDIVYRLILEFQQCRAFILAASAGWGARLCFLHGGLWWTHVLGRVLVPFRR